MIQEKAGGWEGSESQTRSKADHTQHLAEHRLDLTHVAMNTKIGVNCEKKKVRTIPLDSHITTVWSTPFLYATSNACLVFH